jgi:hypothetical protein
MGSVVIGRNCPSRARPTHGVLHARHGPEPHLLPQGEYYAWDDTLGYWDEDWRYDRDSDTTTAGGSGCAAALREDSARDAAERPEPEPAGTPTGERPPVDTPRVPPLPGEPPVTEQRRRTRRPPARRDATRESAD